MSITERQANEIIGLLTDIRDSLRNEYVDDDLDDDDLDDDGESGDDSGGDDDDGDIVLDEAPRVTSYYDKLKATFLEKQEKQEKQAKTEKAKTEKAKKKAKKAKKKATREVRKELGKRKKDPA